MDLSIGEMLLRAFDRYADRPAIHASDGVLSYAELGRRCAGFKRQLRKAGIAPGGRIGIATGDDLATYVAVLGVLLHGSAYVPLSRKAPLSRNLKIVADAGLSAIAAPAASALTAAAGRPVIVDPPVPESFSDDEFRIPQAEATAYLLFTSGSTGRPKGVPITHANLNRFMTMLLHEAGYEFSAEDRFLQMFELTFDLSVMSLLLPLAVGGSCHVVPDGRVGFVGALKLLEERQLTVALMVPSLLAYVEPYLTSIRLPDLRLSMFCGEALQERLVEKWHGVVAGQAIHNWYGPTEATIFCMRHVWSPDRSPRTAVNGIVPIGRPVGDTTARLVDDSGTPIDAAGVKGELVIGGRQLTTGYWLDPERTAQAFLPGSPGQPAEYRTGDVCFRNEVGQYVYCGRTDAQIKIDGHRVELGEIEHAVRSVTNRSAVAVVPVPDGPTNALVLFLEQPELDVAGLRTELKRLVPAYMVPRRVRWLERLPHNLSGKLDRPALASMYRAEAGSSHVGCAMSCAPGDSPR